jgi:hypothetical protein
VHSPGLEATVEEETPNANYRTHFLLATDLAEWDHLVVKGKAGQLVGAR